MAVIYLPCLITNNPIIIDKPILIFYFCAGWAIEYLILFRNGTYIDVFLEYNRLANTPAMKEMKGLNLDYTGQDITNYVARGDDNWGNHGEFAGALYSERTARMGETIYLNNISKNSTIISRHYISYIINALSKGRIIIK